jgi:hypothetical protein
MRLLRVGNVKSPTPLTATVAPSCFQLFVGWPHLAVNACRAAMIAVRSRVVFGRHCAAGISAMP